MEIEDFLYLVGIGDMVLFDLVLFFSISKISLLGFYILDGQCQVITFRCLIRISVLFKGQNRAI